MNKGKEKYEKLMQNYKQMKQTNEETQKQLSLTQKEIENMQTGWNELEMKYQNANRYILKLERQLTEEITEEGLKEVYWVLEERQMEIIA